MIYWDKESSNKIYNNDKFKELQGLLSDKEAKISLAEFLYNNLGVTTFLLTGIRLFPFQEIILRSWFDHNFNMNVWGRGCSKSYLVSIFCCLYPLFNPECKIILASNVFRSTRRLIVQIEKIINGKNAKLLSQCFPRADGELKINRRSDEWHLGVLNGAFIRALPLNDKIRGERADVLIIDEFLLVGEEIYKSTLLPFLASKTNITEQLKIQEQENAMVLSGDLTKEQRTILSSTKKIIGLTSASYDFEFVAQLYKEWVNNITNPLMKAEIGKKFFVSRLSYKATPPELIDEEISEIAKSGGEETASFKREFMAQFSSSSDSFFNIRKLHQYTVKSGDLPCVQLKGNENSKYILSIDPNFNSASTSDMFGIATYLLNDDARTITLVNSYGMPGGNLSDHLAYLYYVLTHFNIVFIVADLAGSGDGNNFISAANQSNLFMKNNMKLSFIEGDFDADDYANQLTLARNSYNLTNKRIVYRQIYRPNWIRIANESLQTGIDSGKVHFSSGLSCNDTFLDAALKEFGNTPPVICKDVDGKELGLLDFIAYQDDLITQTKNQLSLIEPKISVSTGNIQFDLPQNLKRSKSPTRARRDLYACLLMGYSAAKNYWDFMYNAPTKKKCSTFSPRLIR